MEPARSRSRDARSTGSSTGPPDGTTSMIVLAGADVILPDRILSPGTVVIEGDLIVDVLAGGRPIENRGDQLDLQGHFVVPGFIDVHLHGVEGHDTLDNENAIRAIADRLPRFGVTAFSPTS